MFMGLFCVVALYGSITARDSYLSKLPLHAGEHVVFEDTGATVTQSNTRQPKNVWVWRGGNNAGSGGGLRRQRVFKYPETLLNCRVRLTTHRIIVAQKVLAQDRWFLRYVFNVGVKGDTSMSGMYITSYVRPRDILVRPDPGRGIDAGTVELPLGSGLLTGQVVTISTAHLGEYKKLYLAEI